MKLNNVEKRAREKENIRLKHPPLAVGERNSEMTCTTRKWIFPVQRFTVQWNETGSLKDTCINEWRSQVRKVRACNHSQRHFRWMNAKERDWTKNTWGFAPNEMSTDDRSDLEIPSSREFSPWLPFEVSDNRTKCEQHSLVGHFVPWRSRVQLPLMLLALLLLVAAFSRDLN